MIQHYLVGKTVGWYTLEEVKRGKRKDFVRVYRTGKVIDVDSSNTLALIESDNEKIATDIAELTRV